MFTVYILRCADSSLYVGLTRDLEERVRRHNEGRAAAWTAARRPVHVVFVEEHPTLPLALMRERQLKRWSHAKKEALAVHGVEGVRHWSAAGHS